MAILKRRGSLFSGFIIFFAFASCVTYNRSNPYPGMETVRYGNSQAYVFENELSDKLIISIEGSGWDSALGTKNEKKWTGTGIGAQMIQVLRDKYTFFIPEKLKRQPGMVYSEDMEDRANYTAGNLLDCYTESINGYLSEHSFSSIVLIGASEGAALLPLIYERMNNQDAVKALVSIGFGGVSLYESYSILSQLPDVSPEDRNMYQYFVEKYNPGLTDYWDSYAEFVYGVTYRWFNSFKDIRPFEYYKNIDIPILFIHGKLDTSIPVESTAFIQVLLPEKPFEYLYYNWGHQPVKRSDVIGFRNDIARWIIEKTDL